MKTKELIEQLQELDPDNECDVVVGGVPIYYVDRFPGYYDGHYGQLIQDESKKPYYSIVGYRLTGHNDKIDLREMSFTDCIFNCEDDEELDAFQLEFDFATCNEELNERRKQWFLSRKEAARWLNRHLDAEKKHSKDSPEAKETYQKYKEMYGSEYSMMESEVLIRRLLEAYDSDDERMLGEAVEDLRQAFPSLKKEIEEA